jgi:hypothetical protein
MIDRSSRYGHDRHWVERLDITTQPLELENVNDDLKREATLYATAP